MHAAVKIVHRVQEVQRALDGGDRGPALSQQWRPGCISIVARIRHLQWRVGFCRVVEGPLRACVGAVRSTLATSGHFAAVPNTATLTVRRVCIQVAAALLQDWPALLRHPARVNRDRLAAGRALVQLTCVVRIQAAGGRALPAAHCRVVLHGPEGRRRLRGASGVNVGPRLRLRLADIAAHACAGRAAGTGQSCRLCPPALRCP
jgi:hypothetical protein